jgi:hypothetical protein
VVPWVLLQVMLMVGREPSTLDEYAGLLDLAKATEGVIKDAAVGMVIHLVCDALTTACVCVPLVHSRVAEVVTLCSHLPFPH